MRLTCEDSALQPHRNSEQLNLLDIECIQIVTMIVRYVLAGRGALVASKVRVRASLSHMPNCRVGRPIVRRRLQLQ
jgi:hypothetical protein